MTASAIEKIYTIKEYLELEKNSEVRHEFYYGKLLPMPGESKIANQISKNILKKWDDVLESKGFNLFNHDVKAEIKKDKIFRYPYIVITPETDNEDDYIVKQPIIMVEVASNDSWKRDTHNKKREYTALPSLQYYIIVSQEEMYVEVYSRGNNGWQSAAYEQPNEMITLPKYDLKISISEIYHRIKFADLSSDSGYTEG